MYLMPTFTPFQTASDPSLAAKIKFHCGLVELFSILILCLLSPKTPVLFCSLKEKFVLSIIINGLSTTPSASTISIVKLPAFTTALLRETPTVTLSVKRPFTSAEVSSLAASLVRADNDRQNGKKSKSLQNIN